MHVILISKDMLPARDLPIYGNDRFHTPAIDALADTGTLFKQCISPCPSSAMTYSCIWVGRQPYDLRVNELESNRDVYSPASIFARFEERGVQTHVVWDKYWTTKGRHHALPIYGRGTQFHNLDIYNEIGIHRQRSDPQLRRRELGVVPPLEQILATLNDIQVGHESTFTWLHCPHILAGCASIGSDLEYFDQIIGETKGLYARGNIFLLSDHGHMDFQHGEILYGKTMHQKVLHVPLITPRMEGVESIIDEPFSSIRLPELLLDRRVVLDPVIFSINQLPHQPNRILTVRSGRYKYLFYKKYQAEALFDLDFDPLEERNLLLEDVYSRAKKRTIAMTQAIHYSAWTEAEQAYARLRADRERVWYDPGFWNNSFGLCKNLVRDGLLNSVRDRFFPSTSSQGRWGSDAISQFFHF